MHILHAPFFFLTITGLAIQEWYFTSRRIPASTISLTCLIISRFLFGHIFHFFCITGRVVRKVSRLCSASVRGMPVVSECYQANTSALIRSSCFNRPKNFCEMVPPRVMACSGNFGLSLNFSGLLPSLSMLSSSSVRIESLSA
jgi:hypothetical protein